MNIFSNGSDDVVVTFIDCACQLFDSLSYLLVDFVLHVVLFDQTTECAVKNH